MTHMTQRPIVAEWRITSKRENGVEIRYWIEGDPDFGGVSRETAARAIHAAEFQLQFERVALAIDLDVICAALLEALPYANSIEVCVQGQGVVMHRDWP